MSKENVGFVLVDTPEQVADIGCRRIGQISGIPLPQVSKDEAITLADTVRRLKNGENVGRNPFIRPLAHKYRYFEPLDAITTQELHQSFQQAVELMGEGQSIYNSYGIFAPAYETALRIQQNTWKQPGYRSLLVGAMTLETAMEYTATVRGVFPEAETYVVDIVGKDKTKAPGFVYANGLALPFADGSMSSIHTNYLLRMIEGGNSKGKNGLKALMNEAWRCLSDGGQLILCEGNIDEIKECKDCSLESGVRLIKDAIQKQGFADISVNLARSFYSRGNMLRHFRSSNGAGIQRLVSSPETLLITATKKQNVIYL